MVLGGVCGMGVDGVRGGEVEMPSVESEGGLVGAYTSDMQHQPLCIAHTHIHVYFIQL